MSQKSMTYNQMLKNNIRRLKEGRITREQFAKNEEAIEKMRAESMRHEKERGCKITVLQQLQAKNRKGN